MISAESSEPRPRPLTRVAYASLDTSATAKGRQLRGGRGRSRVRSGCPLPGASRPGPLTTVSQTSGTKLDSAIRTGHPVDPDLRIRTPAYSLDTLH
jgi:hypothetical protein